MFVGNIIWKAAGFSTEKKVTTNVLSSIEYRISIEKIIAIATRTILPHHKSDVWKSYRRFPASDICEAAVCNSLGTEGNLTSLVNIVIAPPCGAFDLGLAVSVPLPIVMGIFVLLWFQSRLT